MKGSKRTSILFLAALFVALALLPKLIPAYALSVVINLIIYALFAWSFNMLWGYGGLLCFGNAAHFGVGAYVAIFCYKYFELPLVVGVLGGAVAGAILGMIFAVFLSRYRGITFALLSVAFNQFIFVTAEKWRSVTNGDDGMSGQRPDFYLPGYGRISMLSDAHWYYFVVIVVGLSLAYCYFFGKTPLGRLNVCMKENEERTGFIGFNTYAARFWVYVVAAFFAGIAGALASSYQEFVASTYISVDRGTDSLIMTIVGGSGTFWGPIMGSVFLTFFSDIVSSMTKHWRIVQGLLFVGLVMFAPRGIAGLLSLLKEWLKELFRVKGAAEENVEGVDR